MPFRFVRDRTSVFPTGYTAWIPNPSLDVGPNREIGRIGRLLRSIVILFAECRGSFSRRESSPYIAIFLTYISHHRLNCLGEWRVPQRLLAIVGQTTKRFAVFLSFFLSFSFLLEHCLSLYLIFFRWQLKQNENICIYSWSRCTVIILIFTDAFSSSREIGR